MGFVHEMEPFCSVLPLVAEKCLRVYSFWDSGPTWCPSQEKASCYFLNSLVIDIIVSEVVVA